MLKFKNSENNLQELIKDSGKSLLFLILMLPVLNWNGNSFKDELFEPTITLVHYGLLKLALYNTKEDEKWVGSIAYLEYMLLPVISIILLKLGISYIFSITIPMVFITMLNACIIKIGRSNC